ncbi:ABC transporter permease [Erysipelothrix sp. HDW6C]|uniref:ABC transporter permease n=1 Tax=Erysipelothrix sp. HDW6C TaxID=2714930 RepID=UPI001407AB04|nr:ABC transporter permease [Erysipelothrix sp. HDW6C]QIK68995.1 ABC transporter permease [Erysipelothrix sp. HDW6C]
MKLNMILEHLFLVIVSGFFLLILGLIIGIVAYMFPKVKKPILFAVDVLQTIPTLAMLGLLMVFFGPTTLTVIISLVLYSLLPVVLNTVTGLDGIDGGIKEAAIGMGMTPLQRLLKVELPLAFPLIFSGMRIAIVTSIGVAVFATFVGGGGLGAILYRGVRTQNMKLLAYGTLALVVMSVVIDGLMGLYEKRLERR